ncbi:MAG TPA: uroporphyrinogen-III C-methyltransferase [Tepidisphaeraceae bacterium]|jgi:uroporphyrinogen III methyltransferase/synthase|nr:uroporphyrinogen-III C-methyltransferase [Tepidisphaeraceae bacterium]
MSASPGFVSLVGAGPGDPGLLTVRGQTLLATADVVMCDALANPRLLSHCRPEAEIIFVGKRSGKHGMTQDAINAILVDRAKLGRRVVRLKGGDPFVFGRGGEECQVLAAAGIPFEVVPGVTAGIAVAAYAGIPITHREFNGSVTFITGHEGHRCASTGLDVDTTDWAALAKLPCIAFYMGTKALPDICAKLVAGGMPRTTPAATVSRGTTPLQRTIVGTIADLPDRVAAAHVATPALTIIGRVVELREQLSWFESRPLFGQTIVVTRARTQQSTLVERLEALGANVLEAPTIEIAPLSDFAPLDRALRSLRPQDSAGGPGWVIFTSANAIGVVRDRLRAIDLDARAFAGTHVAAVGEATANALRDGLGLRADLVPSRATADALVDELIQRDAVRDRRLLLLRADIARTDIPDRLRHAGGIVDDVAVYHTRPATALPAGVVEAIESGRVDWITFTSSSTATNLCSLLGPQYSDHLANVRIASIGPVTTETLHCLSLEPAVVATTFNIDGLVDAIVTHSRDHST